MLRQVPSLVQQYYGKAEDELNEVLRQQYGAGLELSTLSAV